MSDYQHQGKLVPMDEWAAPQPEKRRCGCGAILSLYNKDSMCYVCQGKYEKEKQ